MNDNRFEQINSLIANPEFETKVSQAESCEEIRQILIEFGLTLTEEEMDVFYKKIISFNEEKELDEEELSEVAGGAWKLTKVGSAFLSGLKKGWEAGKKIWEKGWFRI